MEESANSTPAVEESSETSSKPETVVIDLGQLSDKQKITLLSVLGTIVLQVVYLLNMKVITDLFKGPVADSYKIVSDYVIEFINTFIPYLILVFVFLAFYFSYIILLGDEDYLKVAARAFEYSLIILLGDFVLYVVALMTISPLTNNNFGQLVPNQAYPASIELFVFLFLLILSVVISLLPFYVNKYLSEKETTPPPQNSA